MESCVIGASSIIWKVGVLFNSNVLHSLLFSFVVKDLDFSSFEFENQEYCFSCYFFFDNDGNPRLCKT